MVFILSRHEFNRCILILTGLCLMGTILAFASLFIFSGLRKSRSERKKKTAPPPSSVPPVSVTLSPTDKNQVSIKIGEEKMEYIDDRNTNVVSSTVQIASIHDSPTPANL